MNARHAIVDAKEHSGVSSRNLNFLSGLNFFGFRMVTCAITSMTTETLDNLTKGHSCKKRKPHSDEQRPKSLGSGQTSLLRKVHPSRTDRDSKTSGQTQHEQGNQRVMMRLVVGMTSSPMPPIFVLTSGIYM